MHHIIRLQRIPCENLSYAYFPKDATVGVRRSGEWEDVAAVTPCKLTEQSKWEDGYVLVTLKLTFSTCQPLAQERRYNYLLYCADGAVRILCPPRRPYPVCTRSRTLPDKASNGDTLYEYTVESTSPWGALYYDERE